ncbi:hypothetical protein GHT06_003835 [Daphnia sinensis]|uniref:Uncharacterized protein n=1 Tax=Daphnia sinensis TaxID=1820382 RepID=A0AAD5KDY3_9CRUS|nr:hypothetical protein GHT06_003835 [Daphnia sinensis]
MTNDTALLIVAAVGLWYFLGPSAQPSPPKRPVDHGASETRDPVPESTVFALAGDSSSLHDIQNSQINYVI